MSASDLLPLAVAVLIVTCPCALSLAVPSALVAAAGALARRGVMLQRLDALEALRRHRVRAGEDAKLLLHHRDRQRRVRRDVLGHRDAERIELVHGHYMVDQAEALGNAIAACRGGVRRVHLVPRKLDGALLLELFTRDGVGTMVFADQYEGARPATIDDVGGLLELIRPLEEDGTLVRRSRERLESEIERFITREYWSLIAKLATPKGEEFEARLVGADGKKITRLDIGSGKEAEDFKAALEQAKFKVASIEAKPAKRHPYPPFTTSTLQQEASRKLGFSAQRTMQAAQKLYEGVDIGGDHEAGATFAAGQQDAVDGDATDVVAAAGGFMTELHGGAQSSSASRFGRLAPSGLYGESEGLFPAGLPVGRAALDL